MDSTSPIQQHVVYVVGTHPNGYDMSEESLKVFDSRAVNEAKKCEPTTEEILNAYFLTGDAVRFASTACGYGINYHDGRRTFFQETRSLWETGKFLPPNYSSESAKMSSRDPREKAEKNAGSGKSGFTPKRLRDAFASMSLDDDAPKKIQSRPASGRS